MIRPAQMSDIPGARSCLDVIAQEKHFRFAHKAPPIEESIAYWSEFIEKKMPFEVAEIDEKIVGWADIKRDKSPAFSHSGKLGIGILPNYRHLGLGRKLLKAVINDAHAIGIERIELTVMSHNESAFNLYKSEGFVYEGLHKKYRKINGVYEDAILMALIF